MISSWVSGAGGSGTVPGRVRGAAAEVRPGATSGKDPADRIRAEGRRRLEAERWKETGDVRLSGLHSCVWAKPEGLLSRATPDGGQTNAGEAAGSQTATPDSHARTGGGNREMASIGRAGLLQLSRRTGQWTETASVSRWGQAMLVASLTPPRATTALELGTTGAYRQPVASLATDSTSLPECSL